LTELLTIDPRSFVLRDLQPAVRTLLEGGVVAAATASYYALMVIADRPTALENLFWIKYGRRPGHGWPEKDSPGDRNSFLLLLDSRERVGAYAQEVPKEADALMDRYWPGLLTIIFKAQTGLHPAILGKRKSSIGLRVDGFPVPGALARMTDRGVTGTSANPHGRPPAASAREVLSYFQGRLDMVVDTGPAPGGSKGKAKGKPSTIVDATRHPFSIVREGAISGKEILRALGAPGKGQGAAHGS
jgi:L-threonylcarbamoyladenylate synthase